MRKCARTNGWYIEQCHGDIADKLYDISLIPKTSCSTANLEIINTFYVPFLDIDWVNRWLSGSRCAFSPAPFSSSVYQFNIPLTPPKCFKPELWSQYHSCLTWRNVIYNSSWLVAVCDAEHAFIKTNSKQSTNNQTMKVRRGRRFGTAATHFSNCLQHMFTGCTERPCTIPERGKQIQSQACATLQQQPRWLSARVAANRRAHS